MYNLNNAVSNELNNYELRGINVYFEKEAKTISYFNLEDKSLFQ